MGESMGTLQFDSLQRSESNCNVPIDSKTVTTPLTHNFADTFNLQYLIHENSTPNMGDNTIIITENVNELTDISVALCSEGIIVLSSISVLT